MYPFAKTTTVRKDFEDGLWIEVKEELSYGDKRALRKAILGAPDDPEATNVRLMELGIASWSIEAPVSRETLDSLNEEVINRILLALDQQYKPQAISEAEKKT